MYLAGSLVQPQAFATFSTLGMTIKAFILDYSSNSYVSIHNLGNEVSTSIGYNILFCKIATLLKTTIIFVFTWTVAARWGSMHRRSSPPSAYIWSIKHSSQCWSLRSILPRDAFFQWKSNFPAPNGVKIVINFLLLLAKWLIWNWMLVLFSMNCTLWIPVVQPLRRHGDIFQRFHGAFYKAYGRSDDTMNLGGIKVSSVRFPDSILF